MYRICTHTVNKTGILVLSTYVCLALKVYTLAASGVAIALGSGQYLKVDYDSKDKYCGH